MKFCRAIFFLSLTLMWSPFVWANGISCVEIFAVSEKQLKEAAEVEASVPQGLVSQTLAVLSDFKLSQETVVEARTFEEVKIAMFDMVSSANDVIGAITRNMLVLQNAPLSPLGRDRYVENTSILITVLSAELGISGDHIQAMAMARIESMEKEIYAGILADSERMPTIGFTAPKEAGDTSPAESISMGFPIVPKFSKGENEVTAFSPSTPDVFSPPQSSMSIGFTSKIKPFLDDAPTSKDPIGFVHFKDPELDGRAVSYRITADLSTGYFGLEHPDLAIGF